LILGLFLFWGASLGRLYRILSVKTHDDTIPFREPSKITLNVFLNGV